MYSMSFYMYMQAQQKTHFCLTWNLHLQPLEQHFSVVYSTVLEIQLQTTHTHTHTQTNTHTYVYIVTHPLKHTDRIRKFLSKWHTVQAPLCFAGRCAPESQASRLDAPLERWIFQEKAVAKSDLSSLYGRKQVLSTFYYLSYTADLWTTTTQDIVTLSHRLSSKNKNPQLFCRLPFICAVQSDQQPTSCCWFRL